MDNTIILTQSDRRTLSLTLYLLGLLYADQNSAHQQIIILYCNFTNPTSSQLACHIVGPLFGN